MTPHSKRRRSALALVVGALALTGGSGIAQEDYEPDFRRSPSSGPRGTRIFLSGDCRVGGPGSSVEVFVQKVSDRRGVVATDYAVAGNGNWSGIITIPKTDLKGLEVTPGDLSIQADCEFENDPDSEFSFADQSFTVTPGDNPDCGSVSCENLPAEVDCVKDSATCETLATQLPGGEAARTASGAPLPARSSTGTDAGVLPRKDPGTAGAPGPGAAAGPQTVSPESAVPLIELRPARASASPQGGIEKDAGLPSAPGATRSLDQRLAGFLLLTTAVAALAYLLWIRRGRES